ncbi:hypothetical protein [Hyphococcus lacteus]|uniref:Cytochrome c domain-containing protein n=1 Tax=Hyphococcus lacteus TaxID=3143536 RepID=A0ABV3Z7E6_9PROT
MRKSLILWSAVLLISGCGQGKTDTSTTSASKGEVTSVESPQPSEPSQPAISKELQEEAEFLPLGPGRDTTIRICSGCHALNRIEEVNRDRQGWYDLVQFMGDRGAMGSPQEMLEITNYLAKNFPPKEE